MDTKFLISQRIAFGHLAAPGYLVPGVSLGSEAAADAYIAGLIIQTIRKAQK
jgi:hypothetical protein